MTGLQRIKATIAGKETDQIPTMLHCFMPAAQEAGLSMRQYRSSAENIAKTHLNYANKYQLDGVLMDIDTCILANAVGTPVDFPDNEPARVKGALSKDFKILIEAMDKDKLYKDDRIKIALDAVNLMKSKNKELCIRGNCDQMAFSLAMLTYGMEDFMCDLLDEEKEESIKQLIDRAYEVHLEYHKLMHSAGADLTSFGDSSCGPDLISRDTYQKYAMPYHIKLKKDLELLSIDTVCHICGNLDNILEDVADVGFPAVEIDYKTNIAKAQKTFEGKSKVFGIIDPSGIFYFGTPKEVYDETKKVIEIFKGKDYVAGAGCALPQGTPEENVRAFIRACRDYK